MPSRDSIEGFREGNSRLAALVQADLEVFFRSLDQTDPAGVRDALLAYVPDLVEAFGEVAQQLAMEWYDQMRFESDPTTAFRAIAPPLPDLAAAVAANIRYAAGHLFRGNPEQALSDVKLAVHKHVLAPGRQTMVFNADQEGVYWARVPTGNETCSFCLIIASRGAVFLSERSAGSERFGEENLYHGKCDCVPVPVGQFEEYPSGYIPEELYRVYEISADKVGTRSDIKAILYDLRRRFPDQVKDGVYDPEYLERVG